MKCANCGAPVTDDSRFCQHCGAKIDDGVKRMEVNINKRIEDMAEIKRAGYEAKESELRQKKAARELRAQTIRRKAVLSLIALNVVLFVLPFIFNDHLTRGLCLLGAFFGIGMIVYMLYLLITGKW